MAKLSLPKRVYLAGRWWKIEYYRSKDTGKCAEGSFDGVLNKIRIDTRERHEIPHILLHEVFEAICSMRQFRYRGPYGGTMQDYMFIMNHDQMDMVVIDLLAAWSSLGNFLTQFPEVKI